MDLNSKQIKTIATLLEPLKQVDIKYHDYLFKELYRPAIECGKSHFGSKVIIQVFLTKIFNILWETKYQHAKLLNLINDVHIKIYREELDSVEI